MVLTHDLSRLAPAPPEASVREVPLDTVMLLAAWRRAVPAPGDPAPPEPAAVEPIDDDAFITWEDAEWR